MTLYLDVRGLSTGPMRQGDRSFQIDFGFVDDRLLVRTDRGEIEGIELAGLSVAAFHARLLGALAKLGIEVEIRSEPFGVPMTTPFAGDR